MTETNGPHDFVGLLRRYESIMAEMETLEEKKQALRATIITALDRAGLEDHSLNVEGRTFRCTLKRQTKVTYDENLLRSRLGDRYRSILAPDPGKIRKHMEKIAPLLEPRLDLVGSPSRELVKQRVSEGTVRIGEFAGAFEKKDLTTLYIRQRRPQ